LSTSSKKIKVGAYYPILLKKAIDELVKNDLQGRRFNQFVIDILLENKEIKEMMQKIHNEEK